MSLGTKVKQRRLERGWTNAELARRTGLSTGYISRLEANRVRRPAADILDTIARALGTTSSDLLDRPEPAPPDAIPPSLRAYAEEAQLPDDVVAALARLSYHGRQPTTPADWGFVWEAFLRAIREPAG